MKKILLVALIFCSCNSNKEKPNHKVQINEPNFYDLYYLDLLERNKNFKPINIDSLRIFKANEEHLNKATKYLIIDSSSLLNLKNQFKISIPTIEILVTDSVKKKLNNSNRKLEVMDYFSKPLSVSNDKKIMLFETHHRVGVSDGAVFFSKNEENIWKLDSTVVLNNYRGGSRILKYTKNTN